jgi:hypothetical protein
VDVVLAVSVVDSVAVLLIVTEVGERAHVAGLVALVGALVIEQDSVTVPVNELPGVTVIVELPVAPGLTLMLPLFVRVKLVLLVPPGASQKSPQPARSGAAASNTRAHFPIFIAAPSHMFRAFRLLKLAYRVSPGRASCLAPARMRARSSVLCNKRRATARIRLLRLRPSVSSSYAQADKF